jgi:hypothetical protein
MKSKDRSLADMLFIAWDLQGRKQENRKKENKEINKKMNIKIMQNNRRGLLFSFLYLSFCFSLLSFISISPTHSSPIERNKISVFDS